VKHVLAAAVLLVTIAVLPAAASPITFTAVLLGPAEEPPNPSPGIGFATVTIDPVAHTLRVEASFSGLLGNTTVSHIHVINGPLDTNLLDTVGPVTTTTPTFPGFPTGVTFGVFDATFDTTLAGTFNPAFVTAAGGLGPAEAALFSGIIDGRAYLNIHSSMFPGGEIRGFLTPTAVPEPSAMLLVGTGLLALVARRRMRRSRS
jgi:hypothetical protein